MEEVSTTIHIEIGTAAAPLLVRWNTYTYWTEPFSKWGRDDSYALFMDEGVVLIDPREPAPDKREELESLWGGKSITSLLTNAWHERDCYGFRKRHGTPVWSAASGEAEHEGRPDHLFSEADELPGSIEAVVLSDWFAGDTFYYWTAPGGERLAFVGDAISAPQRDGQTEFYLQLYGHPTPEEFMAAFERVADRSIDRLCLAHGGSLPVDSLAQLRHTLQNEEVLRTDWPATILPPPGRSPPDWFPD
ncbi:MAG: MBL fold metallo-hydrolase [Chloroflexota bacterium]|nr:MBL fold metallo-hydrolase [Chloroflexota bacterium]MDP6757633.1 MBL fold metallo-hydrolase [Chloroflexota bacterium]